MRPASIRSIIPNAPSLRTVSSAAFVCSACRGFSTAPKRSRTKPPRAATHFARPHSRPFSASATRQKDFDLGSSRSVVRLAGPDAARFLNGLLPAKILGSERGPGPIYTAFLTPHGRILVDVYVYRVPNATAKQDDGSEDLDTWYIEVDASSASTLMKHLKKHKLRSKFKLEKMPEDGISVLYSTKDLASELREAQDSIYAGGPNPRPSVSAKRDQKAYRYLMKRTSSTSQWIIKQAETENGYKFGRFKMGLAEGQSELISEHSLPQESNIDLVNGIDFQKGCYLGQELTIRTHHTGVVRKRVLPVQLYMPLIAEPESSDGTDTPANRTNWLPELTPPAGADISRVSSRKTRSTGKLLGVQGNRGLALCRLEMMTDLKLTGEATSYDPETEYSVTWWDEKIEQERTVLLKAFVPDWIRKGVEASLTRKERQPRNVAIGEEMDEEVEEDTGSEAAEPASSPLPQS